MFVVSDLTQTNPLFIKTGFMKLNEILVLQICKLVQNTIRIFEVNHNWFTPVQSVTTVPDCQRNWILYLKDLEHCLVLIPSDTWVLSYCLVTQKILKTYKKMDLNIIITYFCWNIIRSEFVIPWIVCFWLLLHIVINRLCLVCCLVLWVDERFYIIFEFLIADNCSCFR